MLTEDQIEAMARANWPGIEWDDESLAESAHLREAFRAGVRAVISTPAAPSQPSKYGSPELQALIVAHATQSQETVTLTDEYAGVIAWIGDKQCKRVLTEGAIKHEHTPGVAMRNTAHQCVQEVIIAALREKEQAT